jgi:hypothetical protein
VSTLPLPPHVLVETAAMAGSLDDAPAFCASSTFLSQGRSISLNAFRALRHHKVRPSKQKIDATSLRADPFQDSRLGNRAA